MFSADYDTFHFKKKDNFTSPQNLTVTSPKNLPQFHLKMSKLGLIESIINSLS